MVQMITSDEPISSASIILSAPQQALLTLLIEAQHYAEQVGVAFETIDDLAQHYLQTGWLTGLAPSTTFRAVRYTAATAGVRASENPFVHYLFETVGEERLNHAFGGLTAADVDALRDRFDADWYLRTNPAVADAAYDPFIHYMTAGWRDQLDPSPFFSTAGYLDRHADIRGCGINPFRHWVMYGIAEGRLSGAEAPVVSSLESWESLSIDQQRVLSRMFELDYYRSSVVGDDAGENTGENTGDGASIAKAACSRSTNPRHPTPSFRASKYIAAHPDLRDTRKLPFLQYLFDLVGEDALGDLFVANPASVLDAACAHFDTAWYLYSYPDVEASGQDAFIHYMTVGWRMYNDPSQSFSTRAYLLRYPDIVEAGVNPFLHWIAYGQAEGRSGASSASSFRNRPYAPMITAILINRVAAPLTPECIAAVVHQTYRNMAIVVVGAPLSAPCRTAIASGPHGAAVHYLPADGLLPAWSLLEQSIDHAPGELLWMVQGGWVHDAEFIARLASSFADSSVQLGFGRRLEPDDDDHAISDTDLARKMEKWARHATTPAAVWFPDRLRHDLLAADQNSVLWRRRKLEEEVWREADGYAHLGLWHLYLHMASGGQIADVRDAVLRIPATPVPPLPLDAVSAENDRLKLMTEVRSFWPMSGDEFGSKRHILIVTHGIFAGGAENLPIQMANALAARGVIVSLLIFKVDVNPEMRATLDPGVSIYEADWVMEYGCERFLRNIGCSLIHSHGVIGEMFFFRLCEEPLPVPYIATLHGSYEASSSTELPDWFIAKIVENVDLFVYTADKNLAPLLRNNVRPEQLIKMINAMPVDEAPFPQSRAELGIAEDAIVFTLVARGIPTKGWSTAITAFKKTQTRNPGRSMHLCLVGEGDEPERLAPLHADDPSISFLGFQLRINGLYRMTDVAIVPTRFAGESFPLCIIQALQVNTPVIATNVGEIASMLIVDGVTGGVVVESSQNDEQFDARFADAMHSLVDDARRRQLSTGAGIIGRAYDMATFTDQYLSVYEDVRARFAAKPHTGLEQSEPGMAEDS